MKIPNISCKIEMFCAVNPSEDPARVQKSVSNVFPCSTTKTENYSVSAESRDLASLERICESARSRQSQKAYRRNLLKNQKGDSTWFYLNKQAAFAEKIAICEEAAESPLGPIKVTLTSPKIDQIIEWFASGGKD